MKTGLEKFFPQYHDHEIRNVINIFQEVYEDVKENINFRIKNILKNKKKEDIIVEKLCESFPGYNCELIHSLKEYVDNLTTEQLIDEEVDKLLMTESNYALMSPIFLKNSKNLSEFIKTAIAIGVTSDENETSEDLYDKYDNVESNPSIHNKLENYKNRLGKKILLSEGELKNLSHEDIEYKISEFIEKAISHVEKVINSINLESNYELRSVYFENIHSKKNTFFDLYKIYYKLELNKNRATLRNNETITKLNEKLFLLNKDEKQNINKIQNIEEEIKEETERHKRFINQIEVGKYEIQRIFSLTTLYINRSYTLTYKNAEEEQSFLIAKLAELGTDEIKNTYLDEFSESDNELYNYTITNEIWWKYDKENKKYLYSDKDLDGYTKEKFDSFKIKGKFRNYNNKEQELEIIHLGNRVRKNSYSSTEKLLRKHLSSYNEILDHKGFIFVVKNLEKDSEKLIKILENEFGSLKTSWIEEPVSMNKNGNNNTNSEYNSIKGTLKVNYKGKLLRDFWNLLSGVLNPKNARKFKMKYEELAKHSIGNDELYFIKEIAEKLNDKRLNKCFSDLKKRFGEKKYFMEVEIQIFDKDNYIKAEVDKESPAYHGKYKEQQTIETLPIYFPQQIYGKTIKNVLVNELKNKVYKNDKNEKRINILY